MDFLTISSFNGSWDAPLFDYETEDGSIKIVGWKGMKGTEETTPWEPVQVETDDGKKLICAFPKDILKGLEILYNRKNREYIRNNYGRLYELKERTYADIYITPKEAWLEFLNGAQNWNLLKENLLKKLETDDIDKQNTVVPFFLLPSYKDVIKNTLDSLEGDLKPPFVQGTTLQLRVIYPLIRFNDVYMNSDSNLDTTISYKTIKDTTQTCHVVIPKEKLLATNSESAFKFTDKDYSDVLVECSDEFWKEHGKDEFDKSFPLNFVYNQQFCCNVKPECQPLFSYPERVKGYKIKDWTMRMVLGILDVYHFEPFPVKFNGKTYLLNAKIPAFSEEQARKILLKRLYDGFTLYNQDHCYQCEKYLTEKFFCEQHNKRRAERLEWGTSYNTIPEILRKERPLPEIGKMYDCKECKLLPKNYFGDSYTASYFINQDKFKFTAIPKLDTIKLKEVTQGATVNDFFYGFGRKYRETLVPYKYVENEKNISSRFIDLYAALGYENKLVNYEFEHCDIKNPLLAFVLSLATELDLTFDEKPISDFIQASYSPIDFSKKEAINQNPFMLFVLPEETRNEVLFSFVKKVEERGIYTYKSLTALEKEFYTAQLRFARDFYRERSLFDFFAIFGDKNRPFTDSPFFQFLMDNRDFATSFGLSTQTMDTSAMVADYIRSPHINKELTEEEKNLRLGDKVLKDLFDEHKKNCLEDEILKDLYKDKEYNYNDISCNDYFIDWLWVFSSSFLGPGANYVADYLKNGYYIERLQNKINIERNLYLSKEITEEEFEEHIYSIFKPTMREGNKEFSKKYCKKFMKYDLLRLFYAVNEYKLMGGVINPSLKDKNVEYICKKYSDGTVSIETDSITSYVMKLYKEKGKILFDTLFQHPKN